MGLKTNYDLLKNKVKKSSFQAYEENKMFEKVCK